MMKYNSNISSGAASLDPTRLVLHKSMTRLNAASQQSMTRLGGGNHTGSQTTVTNVVSQQKLFLFCNHILCI